MTDDDSVATRTPRLALSVEFTGDALLAVDQAWLDGLVEGLSWTGAMPVAGGLPATLHSPWVVDWDYDHLIPGLVTILGRERLAAPAGRGGVVVRFRGGFYESTPALQLGPAVMGLLGECGSALVVDFTDESGDGPAAVPPEELIPRKSVAVTLSGDQLFELVPLPWLGVLLDLLPWSIRPTIKGRRLAPVGVPYPANRFTLESARHREWEFTAPIGQLVTVLERGRERLRELATRHGIGIQVGFRSFVLDGVPDLVVEPRVLTLMAEVGARMDVDFIKHGRPAPGPALP